MNISVKQIQSIFNQKISVKNPTGELAEATVIGLTSPAYFIRKCQFPEESYVKNWDAASPRWKEEPIVYVEFDQPQYLVSVQDLARDFPDFPIDQLVQIQEKSAKSRLMSLPWSQIMNK